MKYPFSTKLQEAGREFSNGNFGLWFYKLVPLGVDFKACAPKPGDKNVPSYYRETYDDLKKNPDLKRMLEKKHMDQQDFCRAQLENGAEVVEIHAKLQSPLITGIGKTHPNEVGMTFDHTLGIPYLPATGIKGLVRLAHVLNLIQDEGKAKILIQGNNLDDNNPISLIPEIFGGDLNVGKMPEKWRGKAVFLDAYPAKIPDLHVDIMNPHYGAYYSDDKAQTPPADYLDPNPVQFLAVQKGTTFIFRAVVRGNSDLKEIVIEAFHKALTEQGFGAKTAVGYGRFSLSEGALQGSEKTASSLAEEPIKESEPISEEAVQQIWEKPILTWAPQKAEVEAVYEGKKAFVKGKELVPEKGCNPEL